MKSLCSLSRAGQPGKSSQHLRPQFETEIAAGWLRQTPKKGRKKKKKERWR
jgi:hypothetical protein